MVKKKRCPVGTRKSKTGKTCIKKKPKKRTVKRKTTKRKKKR